MPDISIHDMTRAESIGLNDCFTIDQLSEGNWVTKSVIISRLATEIVRNILYATDLNTSSKTVLGAINETLQNFADDYDPDSTYTVGECVLYAGSIYQCNTAISSPEQWTPAHWTRVKAVDVGSGGGGGASWTDVIGTLPAGETSITLSNAAITTDSTIDYYTNVFGVNPTNVSVANGSVTLTFDSQASDLGVKVRVS